MGRKTSYSVAPGDNARRGVLNRGSLGAVVGVALLGLVLVFPKEDLLNRLRGEAENDNNLTIAYLQNLVRTEAKDLSLRLILAEKLAAQREFGNALVVLKDAKPLIVTSEDRASWENQDTRVAWAQWRALKEKPGIDPAATESARLGVEQRIAAQIRTAESMGRLFLLLGQSRDVGAKVLVRTALERMLVQRGLSLADGMRAGREALAEGDFVLSSKLYFAAKARTADSEARRSTTWLGVKALLASGDAQAAYEAAVREFDAVPKGDAFHWELVKLALAAAQPSAGAQHVRQAVDINTSPEQLAKLSEEQLQQIQDVAFASADLAWATRVVQAKLIRLPGDVGMREQVAQMAEWQGDATLALKRWRSLATGSAADSVERALDQVFRLSPMLFDDEALLWAWRQRSARRSLADSEVETVVNVFERTGKPEEALAFLDDLSRRGAGEVSPARLVALSGSRARLLLRMGRADEALVSFAAMDAVEALALAQGVPVARLARDDALAWADLLLRRSDFGKALAVLKRYQPIEVVARADPLYWDLLADVAFEARDLATAARAWAALMAASVDQRGAGVLIKPYQAERYIEHVAGTADSLVARSLIVQVYRLHPTDATVFAWIDSLYAAPDPVAIRAFFSALVPADLARLAKTSAFLERRAGLQVALGDKRAGVADYRAALGLGSGAGARIGLWWLLTDLGDKAALRQEMAQSRSAVRALPDHWEVLGAVHLLLGEPRQALSYYTKIAGDKALKKDQDFLWLANFADVLEQSGEASLALRVRRHAHVLLDSVMASLSARLASNRALGNEDAQALMVRVRLGQFSGSTEQARLQKLLGQIARGGVSGSEHSAQIRQQANNLLFSSAMSSGQLDFARQWLWQQHQRRTGDHDYSKLALALAEGDTVALDELMARAFAKFHGIDRYGALRQLKRSSQALNEALALSDMGESPRDEELQQGIQELTLSAAQRVRLSRISKQSAELTQSGTLLQASAQLTPGLRLTGEWGRLQNRSALAQVADREFRLGLDVQTELGQVEAAASTRQANASHSGWRLALSRELGIGARIALEWQVRQASSESAAMAVAGMQSGASMQLTTALSPQLQLQAMLSNKSFETQSGSELGGRALGDVALTYGVRQAYPDVVVRASIQRSVARHGGTVDALAARVLPIGGVVGPQSFIGPSSTGVAVSVGYGSSVQSDNAPGPASPYSRVIRPYAELGVDWRRDNQGQRTAPLLRLGARGSVVGRDQLLLGWELRPQSNAPAAREFKLQYEYLGN